MTVASVSFFARVIAISVLPEHDGPAMAMIIGVGNC